MGGRYWWVGVAAVCLAGCVDRGRPREAEAFLTLSEIGDFGEVPVHSRAEREVLLRNLGRGPVEVADVWTHGGSEAFGARLLADAPLRLLSGDEERIRLTFRPRRVGEHAAELVMRTNGRGDRLTRIPLTGRGLDAVAKVDPQAVDFGRLEADSTKVLTVRLRNPSGIPLDVTLQPIGADKDELAVTPALTLQPGEERMEELRFSPVRVGRKQLALVVAPCPGCPDEVVTVAAEALEQAVVPEPPVIDFGELPVDRQLVLPLKVKNISTEPMELHGFEFESTTDPSFAALQAMDKGPLGPGEERSIPVRYSPGHMGPASGKGRVAVNSRRHPHTEVALRGHGGTSELCVSPGLVDFGEQPVGARATAVVSVRNCGAQNAPPLDISDLVIEPDAAQPGADAFLLAAAIPPRTLNAGEEMTIRVAYEPTGSGHHAALLSMRSSGFNASRVRVALTGNGRQYPPCRVELSPALIDFGTVPPGRGAVLGLKVENRGADLCAIKNIRLRDDAGGSFRMPGGPLDGAVLRPTEYFSFQVAFVSPGSGLFNGSLELQVADPADPARLVPLSASSQPSCLVASPTFLDFGFGRPDCPVAPRQTTLTNTCSQPVNVTGVTIGPGTTVGEFTLTTAPPVLPLSLGRASGFGVEVAYAARTPGMNMSPLFIGVDGLTRPLLVPLLGESSSRSEQTDRFVQTDGSKVDLLLVVDNTASMVEEQPRLVSAVPELVTAALARGGDFHLAVTTTGVEPATPACPGGAEGGEAGRLFPVDRSLPRILTRHTANLTPTLQRSVAVGQCAYVEKGLEAVRLALTPPLVNDLDDARTAAPADGNAGFLRDEAPLVVIFVGDEDDHSPADVESYVKVLRTLKDGDAARVTVHAIAPDNKACSTAGGSGSRYQELAKRLGGDVLSICEQDYGPLMRSIATRAFAPRERFPLSARPDPATLEVSVDGALLTSGWSYDPTANHVSIVPAPAPAARIALRYRRACP